jgi:protease I
VTNAGGIYEDMSVVKDGNWISSRDPHDLLQFNREMVAHFSPAVDAQAREHTHALPVDKVAIGAGKAAAGVLALATVGCTVLWLKSQRR